MSAIRRKSFLLVVGVAVLSAAITAGGVYAWQQVRLDSSRDRLERARAEAEDATEREATLSEDLGDLRDRLRAERRRRLAAQEGARQHQDCVARVSDQDSEGSESIAFGYLAVSDDEANRLLVDDAEWFTGEEANEAAAADGVVEAGEPVPNDYYIRNEDRSRAPMRVAQDAVVVLSTVGGSIPAPQCFSWREFEQAMRDPKPSERLLQRSPYWLTVGNGEIVRIVEQYLP